LNVDQTFAPTKGHEKDRDEPADIESGLLEFYQDLLEARQAGDAEYAMKNLRLLPALLERQGIQTGSKDVETSVCGREAIGEERHCGRTEEIRRPRTWQIKAGIWRSPATRPI
jgi:hypothetical protein